MSRKSLSNLTKPALIMVSSYMVIHMFAFFIAHSNTNDTKGYTMEVLSTTAPSQNMIPDIILPVEQKPAPQIIYKKPAPVIVTDMVKIQQISPSGELIP